MLIMELKIDLFTQVCNKIGVCVFLPLSLYNFFVTDWFSLI